MKFVVSRVISKNVHAAGNISWISLEAASNNTTADRAVSLGSKFCYAPHNSALLSFSLSLSHFLSLRREPEKGLLHIYPWPVPLPLALVKWTVLFRKHSVGPSSSDSPLAPFCLSQLVSPARDDAFWSILDSNTSKDGQETFFYWRIKHRRHVSFADARSLMLTLSQNYTLIYHTWHIHRFFDIINNRYKVSHCK